MSTEFDRFAEDYEQLLRDPIRDRFTGGASAFFHKRKWILIEAYLRKEGLQPKELSWLDIGCGKGELLGYGKEAFKRVIGCDPSSKMAESADVEVVHQNDPLRLPFEDKTFDLVTAVCVYHHVPQNDRAALTQEVRRVLRTGGRFIIIEHNPYNPVTRLIVSRTPVDADACLLTASQARACMRQAGMHSIATKYFLYLPERVYWKAPFLEELLRSAPLGGQYAVFAQNSPTTDGDR